MPYYVFLLHLTMSFYYALLCLSTTPYTLSTTPYCVFLLLEESLKFTQNNKELLKLPQIPSQNFAVTKVVGAYSIKLYGSVNSAFIAMAKF